MQYSALKAVVALGLASLAAAQHTKQDDEMGPAAFLWPADRVWSGDMDNQEPCGSRSGVANRTKFPLLGGKVALVAQDDYYNTKLSIAYKNEPAANSDFNILVDGQTIADLNPGHTCVDVPNPPSFITAGSNATLQIVYRADWDAPHNQTFYACADITYVEPANFNERISGCFNITEPGEDDIAATASPSASSSNSASNSGSSSGSSSGGGGGNKLSGGAIAGIVIGAIAGVGLLVGAALFFYRRSQQQKRNSRLARMEENARRSEHWTAGKDSTSQNSVKMNNLA